MKLLELVEKRFSARSFTDKEVEQKKLDYILEVARLAPSACNLQPWAFLVIKSKEACEDLRTCYDRDWFKTAPMYIVVCGNHQTSWKRSNFDGKDHCDVDAAIAAEHIALAVEEEGLGACWVCNFDPERCKKVLKLPQGIEPIVILPIGYVAPDFKNVEKKRKATEEVVLYL